VIFDAASHQLKAGYYRMP